jgi:hypothetical protein
LDPTAAAGVAVAMPPSMEMIKAVNAKRLKADLERIITFSCLNANTQVKLGVLDELANFTRIRWVLSSLLCGYEL